ncbi:hypothetical protein Acr_01g0006260 [Actinidia rufa]|uniref:Uncharacterized protein n=1 Tax=Actinidia rufa TaxID=165716 RepID=A0A7J0E578_9ERIC|nr:hypothetical protein Acr_01g0006260 [Actinidia rufa]
MLSSGSKAANDLDFPLVQPAVRDLVEDSFVSGGGANTSSKEVDMAPKPRVLAQKKPKVVDPLTDVQVPLPVQDLVLALLDPTEAKPSLPSSSFLRKCKGKSTRGGSSPRLILPKTMTPVHGAGRHAPIGYGGPCCRGFDRVWRSDCDAARSSKDLSSPTQSELRNTPPEVKKASKRASTLESNLKKAKEKLNVEEAASKVSDNAAYEVQAREEYMNQLTKGENEGVAKVDGADAGNKLGAGVGGKGAGNEGQDIPRSTYKLSARIACQCLSKYLLLYIALCLDSPELGGQASRRLSRIML